MRKLAHSGLVVTLLGLPLGLAATGCSSDDAGGNDADTLKATGGKPGTVAPNTANSPEEYYKQHKAK